MAAFDSTLVARFAAGLYNTQIGNATLVEVIHLISGDTYDSVADLANVLYSRDFASMSNASVAAIVVDNVGITGASDVALAIAAVKDVLDATPAANKGAAVLDVLNVFANWADAPAQFAGYVTAFNAQVKAGVIWAQTPGSIDVALDPAAATLNKIFTLTGMDAAGADVMRLTGDQDVRINFTNPANQVVGLDLDGDGIVEFNGSERSVTGVAANYEIVDAYSRNPLDHTDRANNFLGDIWYDGEGFDGDGVSTNGNIFLGGLGVDSAFGGVGNDFLAGGGIAQGRSGSDYLSGGRNADFFFAEFAPIDATDGSSLSIDGGVTADDNSAGNGQSAQDSDWLLLEATDDDEPVSIWLNDDNVGPVDPDGNGDGKGLVQSRAGTTMVIDDIENIDASGNLYGFLDDVNVEIGARASDPRATGAGNAGGANFAYGTSAQLNITGSYAGNIIIAGYDNDFVDGDDGDDLLFGGNLNSLKNPNLANIWNNGRDELVGGNGDDDIVFETDGGIYEGGTDYEADDSYDDTLWLTREAFGKKTAGDVTSDGTVRIDLLAGKEGGLANAAGYGGADKAAATGSYTSDQTQYKAGFARAQVQDFEAVIATGLGDVDYLAAGANDPELLFDNQQNHFAFVGNLDLRGTHGDNVLYAVGGTDVLEGRGGNDALSGGDANDDFVFSLNQSAGDGVDVIHRQTDANGDNLWDTDAEGDVLYQRDFNIGGSSTKGASALTVDLGTTNLASADVAMTSFSIKIGTVTFAVTNAAALTAAVSAAEVAALVNSAYQALDTNVSAKAVGNTIVVTDLAGRDISDTVAEGYAVGGVVSNGAFSAQATFAPAGTSTTKDRLIYKAYEDRLDNEGVDDDSVLGSTISLGDHAYAEDLVINFADEDGDGAATTRIAENQSYSIKFTNVTTQDTVTITVNGVNYTLQVGKDLDGNIIAAEDGVGDTQPNIQAAFLARMNGFINSFMDANTSAGAVDSAFNGTDTLVLSQRDYNGEETVFMVKPTVDQTKQQSGGEPWKATVTNTSSHEVELLDFDGRNAELNSTNVRFIGQENVDRAVLETAANAGGKTISGSEALVIDVGPDNLQDQVFGTTTAIPNNTASNSPLSTVPNGVAVHGDDFILGGAGLDVINAGTGDDRVEGSIGGNGTSTWDVLDGGKNFYAVQVLGEAQARVYVLNKWEAAHASQVAALSSLTISSITLINQSETGTGTASGVFDDTLQFSQKNFTSGVSRFTVTLNDFTLTNSVVDLKNDGAGTVGVDVDGNGTIDNVTKFTNFENIRTVSGVGNAVAGDGQGNDTLDVTLLSNVTTGAGGISYNLTNTGAQGEVRYSIDAILTNPVANDFPVAGDYDSLVLRVDGVENVIAGTGADLLTIDETEAAKNNTFTAGLGVDRIDYLNTFADEATDGAAEPTVTITVDGIAASAGGVDTVTMTGGRVGTTVATDSLGGVEYIGLNGNTAEGIRENDVLNVSAISGATVSYNDGTVKAGSTTHVTIQGLADIERVNAGAGNDVVKVADSAIMDDNARNDVADATPAQDIQFMSYLDFDDLNANATTRKSFAAQVAADEITQVVNQGEFTYSLSEGVTTADTDRVDYSLEDGRIIVPVGQATPTTPQYVIVSGTGDSVLTDSSDRIDALRGVEEIVAAKGESVMDFTAIGQARQITYQYVAPAANPAENGVYEQTIRIADGSGNAIAGLNGFVELYTYNKTTPAVADATWNRIEGSDAAETVIYQGSEDLVNAAGLDHRFTNDTLNLRGGNNEVRYSPLETSITATIQVIEENAATAGAAEGRIVAGISFQDGVGNALAGGGSHIITSHTSDNSTAAGNLKIEGSQDAEDIVTFTAVSSKTFILGTSPGVVSVKVGSLNSIVLTGFEYLGDASTNDVYDLQSISQTLGLTLFDTSVNDHDAVIVAADAINYNGSGINTIDLDNLGSSTGGYNFDFDVLDVTRIASSNLVLNGGTNAAPTNADADASDEVVLGVLSRVVSVNDFEAMVLTDASVTAGSTFSFNAAANTLKQGSTTISTSADKLSFGGLVLEQSAGYGKSYVANVATGVTVNVEGAAAAEVHGGAGADTLNGGNAGDVLRGNGGADTLNGGLGTEVRTIQLDGILDGAANSVSVTFDGDGAGAGNYVVSVSEGVEVVLGAGSDAVGAALATKINANLTALNLAAGWNGGAALASASFDAGTDLLTFTFTAGVDVTGTIAAADTDGGTFAASSTTTITNGGNGGADTYVFEDSATANGVDIINNFDVADVLGVSAFLGGATVKAAAVASAAAGLDLTGAANYGVVFNKASLAASDIAAAAAAGKIAIEDNGRAVVLVTADVDGVADATNQAYDVYFIRDTNTSATAQTWSVAKVATLNSVSELAASAVLTGAPVAPPPPPPPVGTVVTLVAGSSAPVAGTGAVEIFSLDVVGAKALTANTQINLSGFIDTSDALRFNLPTASGTTSLAALNGQQGVVVQFDPFSNSTLVTFGADADGDLVSVNLVGVADAALVEVDVV